MTRQPDPKMELLFLDGYGCEIETSPEFIKSLLALLYERNINAGELYTIKIVRPFNNG